MSVAAITDPLRQQYREAFITHPRRAEHLADGNVALLCIDVQYLDAADGFGLFADPDTSGVPEEGRKYYFDRLQASVLPGMKRLQEAFRGQQLEVIHCRICALTQDGRDRSAGHRRLHLLAAPGSKEAEFLEEVAPVGDEIVINKTASGVFSSTNIHYVLSNMGIRSLYLCGVYTNECVETAARDACDLGYFVTVVEDACATVTERLHEASIATLRDRYARISSVREVLRELDELRDSSTAGIISRK
ncbi:nicotinamidase-related amidase [Haloferula luteola]|uniref:Nicotinamidase-related amidase n=1 Tax=Haloferula luteola TaxID=595692 RepID=A0A840VCA5_9BACT|nr:isochorismatase family cysteine hydrolase [Haloferula luteola]MBB5353174.1 nicotinamidase-related amidase [Haloferula luteola]